MEEFARAVRDKTLQEIDGEDWGETVWQSYVMKNTYRLRRVPLKDFTVEDLRLMVAQSIGLEHLIPLALEILEQNPLAAGHHYDGDLLESVGRVRGEFWQQSPDLRQRWDAVAKIGFALKAQKEAEEDAEYEALCAPDK